MVVTDTLSRINHLHLSESLDYSILSDEQNNDEELQLIRSTPEKMIFCEFPISGTTKFSSMSLKCCVDMSIKFCISCNSLTALEDVARWLAINVIISFKDLFSWFCILLNNFHRFVVMVMPIVIAR